MSHTKTLLGVWILALAVAGGCSSGAAGQNSQPSRNAARQSTQPDILDEAGVTTNDQQQINVAISEMLAAWQLGNIELLHKNIADDIVVVSGAYGPPVIGWAKYLEAYQQQRQSTSNVRFDRRDTFVIVKGATAWATYQWEYAAAIQDQTAIYRGHTSLVFEKRGGKWLIVFNHTSLIPDLRQAPSGGGQD